MTAGTEVWAVFHALTHCAAVCPGSLHRLHRPLFGQLAANFTADVASHGAAPYTRRDRGNSEWTAGKESLSQLRS